MESIKALTTKHLFQLQSFGLTILIDKYANIFWKIENSEIKPLTDLPWKLQLPFYLTFLHDDRLIERFKDFKILGAIDIYIKTKYFLGEELNLDY